MLKHRIIPVILWNGKQAVQSVQFKRPHRNVGSMMQHIRIMETRNIDELIILDVNATIERRKPLFNEIKEFTKELFCPVTIGGGITELDDVSRLIQECGADKIAINTAIQKSDTLIDKIANRFGSQAIVAAIDDKANYAFNPYNWNAKSIVKTEDLAVYFTKLGAGEILLTSVNQNGTMKGYDTEILEKVSDAVDIPVIINGGCGKPLDMVAGIACGAAAVAASSLFLFTEHTPRSCAKALQEAGLPVRMDEQNYTARQA